MRHGGAGTTQQRKGQPWSKDRGEDRKAPEETCLTWWSARRSVWQESSEPEGDQEGKREQRQGGWDYRGPSVILKPRLYSKQNHMRGEGFEQSIRIMATQRCFQFRHTLVLTQPHNSYICFSSSHTEMFRVRNPKIISHAHYLTCRAFQYPRMQCLISPKRSGWKEHLSTR